VSGKSNKIILAVTEDIEKYISLALSDKNLFEEEDFRRDRKRSQKENEENENSSECIEVILTQTKCKTFYSSDLNRLLSPRVMKRLYAFYNSYKIPDDSHPASLLFFIVFIVCVRNRKEFAEAVKFISYNSKNFGVV
jgi:hypothetical protein